MWGRDMQEKSITELKRWKRKAREKKWPELNFRKTFCGVVIQNQILGHPIMSGILGKINERREFLVVLGHKTKLPIQKSFQEIVKL